MKVKSESEVAQSCPTPGDHMDCSPPGCSVHGFSRQEYWSGVSLPSPGPEAQEASRKNARGRGLQPKVGWDGRGPYAQHFKYLRPPCRGSSSETPPGWALSAPGICEEGSRELAPCAESETGSQCVRSHNASSGLVLALRMRSFRERRLWPLKDL